MKVSKRERTLLVIVLLLALVCAYYLLFLKPYLTEINDLNIQKMNSETQVQTYSQLKKNVDAIDIKIEEKKAEILEYSNDISIGFDQPPVLVYLEDTVGKHAQKNMFVFGAPFYVGQMTINPVNISMITTYDGLKAYIEDVTNGDYIINVSSIEVMVYEETEDVNEQIEEQIDEIEPEAEGEELTDGSETDAESKEQTDGSETAAESESEGYIMIKDSDELIEVTLVIEVYCMNGNIIPGKDYEFDNNAYSYGGDIFY